MLTLVPLLKVVNNLKLLEIVFIRQNVFLLVKNIYCCEVYYLRTFVCFQITVPWLSLKSKLINLNRPPPWWWF